jgi:hypothetical protein
MMTNSALTTLAFADILGSRGADLALPVRGEPPT